MARLTIEEIFSEPDEFGLLDVSPRGAGARPGEDSGLVSLRQVSAFFDRTGRMPDPDTADHEEMRLGTIWAKASVSPWAE